jgi:tRNA:m4X modification enzyme
MIFEDNVQKHILKCPKSKKRKRQENEVFFSENINAGGYGQQQTRINTTEEDVGTVEWSRRLARRVLEVHQSIFRRDHGNHGDLGNGETSSDHVNSNVTSLSFKQIHDMLPMNDLSQVEFDAGILPGFQSHHIKSGDVHQLASLIGHLRKMKVLPDVESGDNTDRSTEEDSKRPLVFLEMGAGRGMFGLAAAGVFNASHSENPYLIMVERTGSRSKADKAFRNIPKEADKAYLNLDNIHWSRCCCDLSHVNLPVLLQDQKFSNAQIVVLAKHLCGAGTDLALKSMLSIQDRISACILATCCHGICDWQHYAGRDYLRDVMEEAESDDEGHRLGFGAEEFNLLRRWCAASVATTDNHAETGRDETSGEAAQHNVLPVEGMDHENKFADNDLLATNISSVVRDLNLSCGVQGLGRACQRLIDYGRYQFLQQQIFSTDDTCRKKVVTKLSHYVPTTVTPQNAALWAYYDHRNAKTMKEGGSGQ